MSDVKFGTSIKMKHEDFHEIVKLGLQQFLKAKMKSVEQVSVRPNDVVILVEGWEPLQ